MTEIEKIKGRIAAIGPVSLNACANSIRRLIEEDLPKLIRNYESSYAFISALDHAENHDKELAALRHALDLAEPS